MTTTADVRDSYRRSTRLAFAADPPETPWEPTSKRSIVIRHDERFQSFFQSWKRSKTENFFTKRVMWRRDDRGILQWLHNHRNLRSLDRHALTIDGVRAFLYRVSLHHVRTAMAAALVDHSHSSSTPCGCASGEGSFSRESPLWKSTFRRVPASSDSSEATRPPEGTGFAPSSAAAAAAAGGRSRGVAGSAGEEDVQEDPSTREPAVEGGMTITLINSSDFVTQMDSTSPFAPESFASLEPTTLAGAAESLLVSRQGYAGQWAKAAVKAALAGRRRLGLFYCDGEYVLVPTSHKRKFKRLKDGSDCVNLWAPEVDEGTPDGRSTASHATMRSSQVAPATLLRSRGGTPLGPDE